MFRKTSGAILCPSCGRLTNADAPVCLVCGRRNPGMWGFAGPLRALFRHRSFTDVVTIVCVVLYVISLLLDPVASLRTRGLSIFAPSGYALLALGATGADLQHLGHWWTVLTAIYLHGDLLHILFNVLWIRQLGPAVEELFGSARLVLIFTVSGVVGFLVSNAMGVPFTIGASGSIFGLLGAMVAFGRRRGGTYGLLVLRQYGGFAILLFVMGLLRTNVNNFAHAGGFLGGLGMGLVLSLAERRAESAGEQILALGLVVLTAAGFVLSLWKMFVAG
jgi:rhomboid protease GluP